MFLTYLKIYISYIRSGERAIVNGVAGLPVNLEIAVILNQDHVYPGVFYV